MGHFNLILVNSEKYEQKKKCGLILVCVTVVRNLWIMTPLKVE